MLVLLRGLVDVSGTLYGTTEYGGGGNCSEGCGTVFSLDPASGAEKVVYAFDGTHGQYPYAGLINIKGTLYGTTELGAGTGCGGYGCGTVFSVNPATGVETVVHSFADNGSDGNEPIASLLNVKGTLYGTTVFGGAHGAGTVFSVSPKTGDEGVLYSFGNGSNDGENPYAAVIYTKGTLYGTTYYGGTNGNGSIFSYGLKTKAYSSVYSFGNYPDGKNPYASLRNLKGTLFGTTENGGSDDDGAVFKIENP